MRIKAHKKIQEAVIQFLASRFNFWGEVSLFVEYVESAEIPTCAVGFHNGNVRYYFNSNFVDSLSQEEVNFVHAHELAHVLSCHLKRLKNFPRKIANIAEDMIINSALADCDIPFCKAPQNAYFIPNEYQGPRISECLAEWLMQKNEDYQNGKKQSPELEKILLNIDDYEFDVHDLLNEEGGMSEGERRVLVEKIANTMKARGLIHGSAETFLSAITKSRKNYLAEFKRLYGTMKGSVKSRTYARLNRRVDGLKGSKKFSIGLNVILDTSGSMCGTFDKILSVIYRDDVNINLIQCDTQVQDVKNISNKNQVKKIKIKGLGGTTLQPAIDYCLKNYKDYNTVLLTDGYTDTLDFSKSKHKNLVITNGVNPSIKGNCKIMKLNEKA